MAASLLEAPTSGRLPLLARRNRRGGTLVRRPKAENVVRGLARLRGGADDCSVVFSQQLQPGGDIVGMAHRRHDAERSTAESGVHLRYQLFERVFLRAEVAGKVAVQPVGSSTGMPQLMQRRAVPVDRLEIGLRRRDLNV